MIKAHNLTSPKGNKVPNQIVITTEDKKIFQSYGTTIAIRDRVAFNPDGLAKNANVLLDRYYWNHSRTTSKYRSIFLNETTKETEAKICDGTYTLTILN